VETVLQGAPRLYASLERQRRENIPAWGEAPGKRHRPTPTRAEGPRHWRGVWCAGPSDRGICRLYVPSPSGWAGMLPRRWRSGRRSVLLSHHMDEPANARAPERTSVSVISP